LKAGAALGAAGLTGTSFLGRALAEGTPLRLLQPYDPGGDVPPSRDWFVKTIADWNATQDYKITLDYLPWPDYTDGTKLPTAFASGEGPDLFIISPGDFLRYYNGGVLTDLTPYIVDAAKADFPKSVIANRMVDGKIYGIPME